MSAVIGDLLREGMQAIEGGRRGNATHLLSVSTDHLSWEDAALLEGENKVVRVTPRCFGFDVALDPESESRLWPEGYSTDFIRLARHALRAGYRGISFSAEAAQLPAGLGFPLHCEGRITE